MKIFDSPSSLDQVRSTPLYDTVKQLLGRIICPYANRPYVPEEDGYLALVEPEDVGRILDDLKLPYQLAEVPFETVTMIDDHFYAFYLANNQFGISFLIPDTEWVNGELRQRLEENLDL